MMTDSCMVSTPGWPRDVAMTSRKDMRPQVTVALVGEELRVSRTAERKCNGAPGRAPEEEVDGQVGKGVHSEQQRAGGQDA